MNFGANAGKTLAVFTGNSGLILKTSVLSSLISLLSLGLMIPVMLSGMGVIFLKLHKGEKAASGDLFRHADKTIRLFGLGLIIMAVALVSLIFVFLPVLVLALWMYAVFFMTFEGKGTGESLASSANTVVQNGFFSHLIAALVLCVVNAAGASFFIVGLIVTLPLTAGFLAFCYEDVKNHKSQITSPE
jgi:hypothetical protein